MTAEEMKREHQRDLDRLRGFRLLDDDFMTRVFDGAPKYIQLALRIILQKPDLCVIEVRTQVFVENLLKRSVQLDIVAVDADGLMYNIEIQRSDQEADPRRARYHSSILDTHLLSRKGTKSYELPEAWVIFITEHDIFKAGQAVYEVERHIKGLNREFQDGSHILYVNGAYRGEDDLGKLMHDFSCTNPDDMYYEDLADRTRFFKESKEGVELMCKALEDMRDQYLQIGIRQGIEQGIQQGMKKGIEQGIQQGMEKGIEQGIQQGMEKGIEKGIQQGMKKGIEQGIQQGMEKGIEQGIQQGMEKGIEQGIQQGMEKGIEQGIQQGMEKGIEQGIQQGMEKGIEQGIQQGMEKGIQQGMEQGIQRGIEQGVRQGMEQGEKNGEQKRATAVALRMLNAGRYAADEIADMSGLSIVEIQNLISAATA